MTMIHIIIPEVLVEVTHSRMVITIHQNFQCIISPQKGHQDLRSQVVASWLSICFCDPMVFTWFCCQSASIIESHELNLLLQHLSGGLQALGKQFNQWRNAPQPLNWGLVRICFCDSIFTDMNIIMTMIPVCFFFAASNCGPSVLSTRPFAIHCASKLRSLRRCDKLQKARNPHGGTA